MKKVFLCHLSLLDYPAIAPSLRSTLAVAWNSKGKNEEQQHDEWVGAQ